jgi:hypothetical protein
MAVQLYKRTSETNHKLLDVGVGNGGEGITITFGSVCEKSTAVIKLLEEEFQLGLVSTENIVAVE